MASARVNFGRLIRGIAEEEGIRVTGFSGDWAFRLEKDGQVRYTVGYHFPLNLASSKELCQDKCLTYEVLASQGIPAAEHLFFPNPASVAGIDRDAAWNRALEILSEGREVVVKNNYGTGGNQVYRVKTEEELKDTIDLIYQKTYAASISPFYEIREEYRVVMLDGKPRLTIRKERESRINEKGEKEYLNWKHNLVQGATGIVVTDEEILEKLYALAKRVVKALGIRFCSVDIIDTEAGLMVLEVNAGVMLEHFSGQSPECFELAKSVYRAAILAAFE
ncbi:MAG: ATP-grasp domain-containing protein [Lachnospiraceae bacterium]|nr:ATP-grasp domain-containing protein [Lachnospiraceae bacterium]